MKLRYKALIGALLLLVAFLFGRCGGGLHLPTTNAPVTLAVDEKSKITIENGELVTVSLTERPKARYIPAEGGVKIAQKKDGTVVIVAKTRGFTIRPGVGLGASAGRIYPVVDLKFAYWSRFGLVVGTGVHRTEWKRPYLAVSYQIYNNTAVFVGCTTDKSPVLGVRISF